MNFVLLETERLLLKGLSNEDMKFAFSNLPKAEIMKLLGHQSEDDYLKEEYKHINGYASYNRSFLLFLLTDKATSTIIGRCGIHNWNKEHNRAEIGYTMHNERFKRKGLMTEAVKAIINYGFTTLQLNRLEALVGATNTPSLHIMAQNNFKQEGILKQHIAVGNTYEDSMLFALLAEEFNVR